MTGRLNWIMDHDCTVVGFLGADKYEYIIYISRVLHLLNKKILMLDYSETGALSLCIPRLPILNNVIENRGVMFQNMRTVFSRKLEITDIKMWKQDYDCILIDFGLGTEFSLLEHCDMLIYVTDQQMHHLKKISELLNLSVLKKHLVIKSYVNHKINSKFIVNELSEESTFKKTHIIYQDELDERCKLNCQYDEVVRFQHLSSEMKRFIKGIASDLYPDIKKQEVNRAYKRAEKGM